MCPQDYPIQMQNACCWSYRRKVDSNCDGDLIANDDPAICCPDEKLFQPLDCKLFKRKCLAPVLENGNQLKAPILVPNSRLRKRFSKTTLIDMIFFFIQSHLMYLNIAPTSRTPIPVIIKYFQSFQESSNWKTAKKCLEDRLKFCQSVPYSITRPSKDLSYIKHYL